MTKAELNKILNTAVKKQGYFYYHKYEKAPEEYRNGIKFKNIFIGKKTEYIWHTNNIENEYSYITISETEKYFLKVKGKRVVVNSAKKFEQIMFGIKY